MRISAASCRMQLLFINRAIILQRTVRNSSRFQKRRGRNSFAFDAGEGVSRAEILIFLGATARPVNHDAIHPIMFSQTKRQWELRLRQVARATFHDSRLGGITIKNAHQSPKSIAIGFCPHQTYSNAAVPANLIIAKQESWAVVGGHQQIEVTVVVEVAVSQPTANLGTLK